MTESERVAVVEFRRETGKFGQFTRTDYNDILTRIGLVKKSLPTANMHSNMDATRTM